MRKTFLPVLTPAGSIVMFSQCNLSDDDDADDLSQHSFLVLSNMEAVAADRSVPVPPALPCCVFGSEI